MIKTFQYRLYPTKAQETKLQATLNECRWLYNHFLSTRKTTWEERQEGLSLYDQLGTLPTLKAERPSLATVHSQVLLNVGVRIDRAFQAFFRRVKAGEKPGYPRFRGHERYASFCYPQAPSGCKLSGDRLTLSGIGTVRVVLHRPLEGTSKTVCIHRSPTGKWYVTFACEWEPTPLPVSSEQVGIDVGLHSFAAFSTGEPPIENPRFFRQEEAALAAAQRKLAHAAKGTPKRQRRRQVVARIHERTRWKRQDFAHQHSRKIVNRFQVIAVEDLSMHRMVRNHCLAKSISDAAWASFVAMLSFKAAWAGRSFIAVNPAYTSQDCSACGHRQKMPLSERTYRCPCCGLELDRDHNAAKNILAVGLHGAGLALESLRLRRGSSHLEQQHRESKRDDSRPRIGRDELNLTEFPLGLLSDRPPSDNPLSLRFTTGDKIWEINAQAKYGLITPGDIEVYLCLMEISKEQGFPEKVEFNRHDLLHRLGWEQNAERYARLELAFNRLATVSIEPTNAYYDAQTKQWPRNQIFHILNSVDTASKRKAHTPDEPPSSFRWSVEMQQSIQAGYLTPINITLFLGLQSAISQRLYRYLNAKSRDGKSSFRQNLQTLAFEHLGLSRHYYPSQIKRKLDPAHQELIAAGFLVNAEYAPTQQSEEMVVYQFPRKRVPANGSRALPEKPIPGGDGRPAADSLVEQLVAHGMTERIARTLAAEQREECERQLSYWPFRAKLKNPAGALRQAIGEAWAAPPGFLAVQERQRMQESAKLRALEEAAKAAREAELHAAQEAAFAAWWAALDAQRQAKYTAAAKEALFAPGDTIRIHFERHPQSLFAALRPYLLERMEGEEPPP